MTEGSVSFSLKELMRLEEERVAAVREEARLREEEAARHARAAREEAEERARAAEARREEEARRAREEEARLEGMRGAALERDRLAAADAALVAEMQRLRRHELDLERLKEGGGARAAWSVGGVSLALLAACIASYAFALKPRADARLEQASAAAVASADAMRLAQWRLDELALRVDGLGAQLRASEERARKLADDLTAARAELERRGVHVVPPRGTHPPPAPTPVRDGLLHGPCNEHDPICAGK
jgi:colicin import membrane protein